MDKADIKTVGKAGAAQKDDKGAAQKSDKGDTADKKTVGKVIAPKGKAAKAGAEDATLDAEDVTLDAEGGKAAKLGGKAVAAGVKKDAKASPGLNVEAMQKKALETAMKDQLEGNKGKAAAIDVEKVARDAKSASAAI